MIEQLKRWEHNCEDYKKGTPNFCSACEYRKSIKTEIPSYVEYYFTKIIALLFGIGLVIGIIKTVTY